MKWFTLEQAIAENFKVHGSPPHCIEFPADRAALKLQIPISPHYETNPMLPGPAFQWFAMIRSRPAVIEMEKVPFYERIFVFTSYGSDSSGDWAVLPDLVELPSSIQVTRPIYIDSRTHDPEHIVYRPATEGSNQILYRASSRSDAEGLLEFLKKDEFNKHCFIGPPSEVRNK